MDLLKSRNERRPIYRFSFDGPFKDPKDCERRKKTSKDVIFIKLQLEKSTITH